MAAPVYNDHQKIANHRTVEELGMCFNPETHLPASLGKNDLSQLEGQSTRMSMNLSDTHPPSALSIGRGDESVEYDKCRTLASTFITDSRSGSPTGAKSKGPGPTTRSVRAEGESRQYTSNLSSTHCANSLEGTGGHLHGVDGRRALGHTKVIDSFLPAHSSFESGATSSGRPHSQQAPPADQSQTSGAPEISAISSASNAQSQLAHLGYKQELYRTWDFWSSFSLAFCNIGVLSGSLSNMNGAIGTSGPIIMTIGFIIMSCFILCVFTTTAEVASSFPVAGAMFSWTFKLARAIPRLRKWARFLSWVIGFCLFLSHIMLQLAIGYDFCNYLSTTFVASGVHWVVTKHVKLGVLLGYILFCGLVSTTPLARSPKVWKILGALSALLHICACLLMVCTAHQKRKFVKLFKFRDTHKSGFSKGYAFFYGCMTSTVTMGSETAAHMAEDTKDPASTVPRVIFWSQLFAIVMEFLSNVCVCLVVAPITPRRTPITSMPLIEAIFWHCPKPVAQFIAFVVLFNHVLSDVSQYLATSRFFWALGRDKAIPLAIFWRRVTPDRRPIRANLLFIFISMVFAVLAYEISDTLRIITRSTTSTLITICYLVPIMLLILAPNDVLARDGSNIWSLRSFSRPVACMGACLLCLTIAVLSGPSHVPAAFEDLPWGVIGSIISISLAIFLWLLYGRFHYVGPVKSLTIWTVGHGVEVPKRHPRNCTPPSTTSKFQTKLSDSKTTQGRSAAYLASEPARTFGIPRNYCTYQSDGSLWTPTKTEGDSVH